MSRRRFFASPEAFTENSATLIGDEARHLREVLRLRVGDQVNVFDGTGKEFRCTIAHLKRDETALENCVEVDPYKPESPLRLTLALALLKGDKFDLVVQKATELGVNTIIPVMTKHSDIHLRDASDADKRTTRWRRIALEATKQSGRAAVMSVENPETFENVIETGSYDLRVLFSERDGNSFDSVCGDNAESVCTLVGSEGGWADNELDLANASGWKIVTVGGRIMRAETAAISVTVLLQHQFGDLK
jgi:16S rRNA (uracil1498-N3)-methyltransferase